jgi:hypothetical protein
MAYPEGEVVVVVLGIGFALGVIAATAAVLVLRLV